MELEQRRQDDTEAAEQRGQANEKYRIAEKGSDGKYRQPDEQRWIVEMKTDEQRRIAKSRRRTFKNQLRGTKIFIKGERSDNGEKHFQVIIWLIGKSE